MNSRLVAASVQMILPCSQLCVCVHHLLEDVCESEPAITLKKKNASKKLSSEPQRRYSKLVLTDFLFSLWFTHGMHQWNLHPVNYCSLSLALKIYSIDTHTEADLIQNILSSIKLGVAELYHDTMQHCTMQCQDMETI